MWRTRSNDSDPSFHVYIGDTWVDAWEGHEDNDLNNVRINNKENRS